MDSKNILASVVYSYETSEKEGITGPAIFGSLVGDCDDIFDCFYVSEDRTTARIFAPQQDAIGLYIQREGRSWLKGKSQGGKWIITLMDQNQELKQMELGYFKSEFWSANPSRKTGQILRPGDELVFYKMK